MFDKLGKLRCDFRDEEIEALTPQRREKFFALVKASTESDAAEKDVRDGESAIRACVVKIDEATRARNAAAPRPDRIDELRRTIRAQNRALGIPVDEEPAPSKAKKAEIAKLSAAIESTQRELDAARSRVVAATANQKIKRATLSASIGAWQGAFPQRDFASVHRDHLARLAAHEMAAQRGEIEEPVEIIPSHFDAIRRPQKGTTINRGYHNPYPSFKLGTRIKLPSQR
jgi:hypothetical protein